MLLGGNKVISVIIDAIHLPCVGPEGRTLLAQNSCPLYHGKVAICTYSLGKLLFLGYSSHHLSIMDQTISKILRLPIPLIQRKYLRQERTWELQKVFNFGIFLTFLLCSSAQNAD